MAFYTHFFKSPNALHDLGLCCQEIAILSYLIRCDSKFSPSLDLMAQKCGMGKTTVKKYLVTLREKDMVVWQSGYTGKSSSYGVNEKKLGGSEKPTTRFANSSTALVDVAAGIPILLPKEISTSTIMSSADNFLNNLTTQLDGADT